MSIDKHTSRPLALRIIISILTIIMVIWIFSFSFYTTAQKQYLNYGSLLPTYTPTNTTNITLSLLPTYTPTNTPTAMTTSSIQEIFKKYITYLTSISDYKQMNESIKINKFNLQRISKKSIIDSLSNKSIAFFGDSLMFHLSSYIIQVLFWCFDDNGLKKTRNYRINNTHYSNIKLILCKHLHGNQSLILDNGVEHLMTRRNYLYGILDKFDQHDGHFGLNQISMIHIKKYNISIYLYYRWTVPINSIQEMMKDYKSFAKHSKFDVMVTNMFGMHLIHAFPIRTPPSKWNMNISWSLIGNMEYYMNEMVINKQNHQCLIFGAMNPVYHGEEPKKEINYHSFNWFSIIIKLFNFGHIEEKLKNPFFIDRYPFKLTFQETKNIISPSILKHIPHIYGKDVSKYRWENHLSYPIIERIMNTNLTQTELDTIWECKIAFSRFVISEKIKLVHYDNLSNNTMQNVIVNFCLLYHYGLGQNLVAQRMKDIVKYYKHEKVYYHDQYSLYANFKNLYDFEHSNVHYPSLQSLSWTNLLNMIQYGC